MVITHDLPTDSVLRRHALTEHNRERGLPPTDSVLKRHYEQLMGTPASSPETLAPAGPAIKPALPATAAKAPGAATAQRAPTPAAAPTRAAVAAPVSPAPATTAEARSGGIFGWLRRLFGG
jgi:hypothetical protein